MSAIGTRLFESNRSIFLSHDDIHEKIAGLEDRRLAKMNQRPKLGR